MRRKVYSIPVTFTFEGVFKIRASSEAEACEHADKHCGMAIDTGIHSALPEEDVDWDFPVHPRKTVSTASVPTMQLKVIGTLRAYEPAGIKTITSRDGLEEGVPTGGRRSCRMEGCTGTCIRVRWADGKATWPCTKSLNISGDGTKARLM